jgi:hypothetical protein
MAGEPLRLRPYDIGDLEAFEPRADFKADMEASDHDWSGGPPAGRSWALIKWDGEVRGVAGIGKVNDELWVAWSILADLSQKEIVQALWLADRAISFWEKGVGETVRLCAYARANNPAALTCLERLNFHQVGEWSGFIVTERKR